MKSILILTICSCILARSLDKPSNVKEISDSEEEEYDNYSGPVAADQSLRDDDGLSQSQMPVVGPAEQEKLRGHQVLDMSGNTFLQRSAAAEHLQAQSAGVPSGNTLEKLSEFKSGINTDSRDDTDDSLNTDQEPAAHSRSNYANKLIKNSGDHQLDSLQQLVNRNDRLNTMQSNRIHDSQLHKRTIGSNSILNEEGESLFETNENNRNKMNVVGKSEYNNEADDSSEQSRYFKQYYNTMQAENRGALHGRNFDVSHNMNRDRRQTDEVNKKESVDSPSRKEEKEEVSSEDEESAIRRHVKKLSASELEELINSLSEDKKELLKKIMQNESDNNDSIIKREITKKSSALEESNCVDSGQLDSNKVLNGSPDMNSEPSNIETTENIKQPSEHSENNTPTTDITTTLATETNKVPMNSEKSEEETNKGKSKSSLDSYAFDSDSKDEAKIDSSKQVTAKTNAKREINLYDLENSMSFENTNVVDDSQDSFQNEGYSQNKDLFQLTDDEKEAIVVSSNMHKRNALSEINSNLEGSIGSLEESFPNSNAYDDSDPYSGSKMAPLVRVKRKSADLTVKKRSAALLPDAKVAYFPYRAENDDEDNDEGNEFGDDGFYDRTSNFAKLDAQNKQEQTANNFNIHSRRRLKSINSKSSNENFKNPSKQNTDNMQSDARSLGSDTDSVLSGVEGVDENLMFNSGLRNRRTLGENPNERSGYLPKSDKTRLFRSTPLIDDEKKPVEVNYLNAPNYQENDAFGPLPRNYEGELGRFKRIRRVKRPPATEVLSY